MNPINAFYRKLQAHHLHGYDPILIGCTALLCLAGVLLIFSASSSF